MKPQFNAVQTPMPKHRKNEKQSQANCLHPKTDLWRQNPNQLLQSSNCQMKIKIPFALSPQSLKQTEKLNKTWMCHNLSGYSIKLT